MEYAKAYANAINFLIEEKGCPDCPIEDTKQNEICMRCIKTNADTYLQKVVCWKKLFEKE